MAHHRTDIVGYAIGARIAEQDSIISWVTQLVVHTKY